MPEPRGFKDEEEHTRNHHKYTSGNVDGTVLGILPSTSKAEDGVTVEVLVHAAFGVRLGLASSAMLIVSRAGIRRAESRG